MTTATEWLQRIRALPLPERIKVMNVCGGHERSITTAGLRKAIPSNIEIVPGPGCPVCICPEEDIYEAIQLALHEGVILVAYGDMLRVPVNAPKSEPRSLEQAKAAGADVRPIASPLEAARVARENPVAHRGVPRGRLRDDVRAGGGAARAGRARQPDVPDVGPAHLARGRDAARLRRARLRGADRARARGHGDGAGGVGVRAARPRDACGDRRLLARVAARGALFGAAAAHRGQVLPRQLLSPGRPPGRQHGRATLHGRDDGHRRGQLARHRPDPGLGAMC